MRATFLVLMALPIVFSGCRERPDDVVAPSADAERSFIVAGVVREALRNGQVVIAHEAIPGFMPAMTMPFYVADEVEAGRLRPGDRVFFRFFVGTSSRAEQFKVVGREMTPALPRSTTTAARARRLKAGDVVPDFNLVDQRSEPLTADQLDGRFTLVTFIFTRCPVPEFCPAMTDRFAALQARIEADDGWRERVRLLSVTLDPEFDRPEVLREYGDAVGADGTLWRLATGEVGEVDALAKAFSVYAEKQGGTIDHTLATALVGPDRRVIEIWRGNAWSIDEVLSALRTTETGS